VKVLDFGLAKLAETSAGAATPNPALSMSPTITSPALVSGVGVILGTAAYMAPEQARGKTVDKRADIWAFGCVLYEMLTGRRAFEDEDVSLTLSRVLQREPDFGALPPNLPPAIVTYVKRCLQKDPVQRVRDIGDVRLALQGAFDADTAKTGDSVSALRLWRRPTVTAMIGASLVAFAWLAVRISTPPPAPTPVRLTISVPTDINIGEDDADPDLAISSDGLRIVFVGVGEGKSPQLYVRALDELEAQPLAGPRTPRTPFFSPDGNWIGFFDSDPNVLKKIAVSGGPAVTLCSIAGAPGATGGGVRGASWGPDNTIVFATNDPTTGLLRVSAGGGTPEVLTRPNPQKGEADHFWPEVLPGGKAVLFTIMTVAGSPAATARGLETAEIAVLDLRTVNRRSWCVAAVTRITSRPATSSTALRARCERLRSTSIGSKYEAIQDRYYRGS